MSNKIDLRDDTQSDKVFMSFSELSSTPKKEIQEMLSGGSVIYIISNGVSPFKLTLANID